MQQGELVKAQQELELLVADPAGFPGAKAARDWLASGEGPRPLALHPPSQMVRPKRPPVVRPPLELEADGEAWASPPPYDLWVVRLRDAKRTEYGPVPKPILDQWVREGRIAAETKLLRADWERWRRARQVYAALAETHGQAPRDAAPQIVV